MWAWDNTEQDGYTSDGQFCVECPRGYTCNRLGDTACVGQCGGWILSECDTVLQGYASCDLACDGVMPGVQNGLLSRGMNNRGNSACKPYPYVECASGSYARMQSYGVVSCQPCAGKRPANSVWATSGLSVNDNASCLWDCDRGSSVPGLAGDGCVLIPGRRLPVNDAGWYMLPDGLKPAGNASNAAAIARYAWFATNALPSGAGTCPTGYTTQRDNAVTSAECVACPGLPALANWASGTITCEWTCGSGVKRGSLCVRQAGCSLSAQGMTGVTAAGSGSSVCEPTAYPWQAAGYVRAGVATYISGVGSGAAGDGSGPNLAYTSSYGRAFYSVSQGYGVSQRHRLVSRNVSWGIQGRLCSMASGWVGGYEFLFASVCNQSFVAYVNLSAGAGNNGSLRVLIGNSTRGWRDGFRTEALFEQELYVASGWGNGSLFVLDRWNCLVREVVITVPGDYLTRVYTVYGQTQKFLLTGEPRCYGEGSLAGPRRFFVSVAGNASKDVIYFVDDNGLWQLHGPTRGVALSVPETQVCPFTSHIFSVPCQEILLPRKFQNATYVTNAHAGLGLRQAAGRGHVECVRAGSHHAQQHGGGKGIDVAVPGRLDIT